MWEHINEALGDGIRRVLLGVADFLPGLVILLLALVGATMVAWVASFAAEMQEARSDEAEHRLEALCLAFEAEKPYLISRWRWPDRFNP